MSHQSDVDPVSGAWVSLHPDHKHDQRLASGIAQVLLGFGAKSVSDFGAGDGYYADTFSRMFDTYAFDGNPYAEGNSGGLVKTMDLSLPADLPPVDWVVTLEVGEHIPPDREGVFLGNVCRSSRVGVILSWAVPGQGGTGHVNERPNQYIIDFMGREGFDYHENESMWLRTEARLPWFKHTIMVFSRRTLR